VAFNVSVYFIIFNHVTMERAEAGGDGELISDQSHWLWCRSCDATATHTHTHTHTLEFM